MRWVDDALSTQLHSRDSREQLLAQLQCNLNKAQQLMKGQAPDAKLQPYRQLYASQRQRVKFSLPLWILLDIAFSLIQQTNSVLIVFFFFAFP
jgi:hypothetical protein